MSYIIALPNQFAVTNTEFIVLEDDNIFTSHSPAYATEFASMKQAKDWYDNSVAYDEEPLVIDKVAAVHDWESDLRTEKLLFRELLPIKPALNVYYDDEVHTKHDVLEWHSGNAKHLDQVPYAVYKSWPALREVFYCIWGIDSFVGAEDDDLEIAPVMAVSSTVSFDTFREEFDEIKHLSEMKDDDDYQIIGVFDYKLSEGGDIAVFKYNLNVDNYLLKDKFDELANGDLKYVFDCWQRKRPYPFPDEERGK